MGLALHCYSLPGGGGLPVGDGGRGLVLPQGPATLVQLDLVGPHEDAALRCAREVPHALHRPVVLA